ncbi:MAG TPA: SDR family oxidoreductase [Polyangiaceae bacterium]|nr:SDR family oxidoreductase [Polyangiaceae bacterium]
MTISVVTGANRGIGLEFCRQLKARGHSVLAACRKSSPELEALGVEIQSGVDVAREEGVKRLAQAVGTRELTLLVNNAGILDQDSIGRLDYGSIRAQFEVNALGPLRVTEALLPRLVSGAKVALITSRMGSIGDNSSGNYYGYRMSKAALNMAGVSLAHDLRSRGIAVAILHPGFVRTEMTGSSGGLEPEESVRGLLARLDALTLSTSGTFWHMNGEHLPW